MDHLISFPSILLLVLGLADGYVITIQGDSNASPGISNLPCAPDAEKAITDKLADMEKTLETVQTQLSNVQQPSTDTTVSVTWKDEVAQAACTAMQESRAWMFAVRRSCSGDKTCAQICSDLASSDNQATRMECIDSLHVYSGTHPQERGFTESSNETLGTKVFRYFSCSSSSCGPNFCCCKGT